MADRGDTHYHVPNLNAWFVLSSLFLLVVAVWMVLDDYSADWKDYQREFRAIELERTEAELASAEAEAVRREEALLAEGVEAAEAALSAKQEELETLEGELKELRGNVFTATEAAKEAKQQYNWERYLTEEHRLHEKDPTWGAAELAEYEQRMIDTAYEQEQAEIALRGAQARRDELMADVIEAEEALKGAGRSIELVRKKKQTLAPDDPAERVANFIRDDIPGLDFIGPSIKVEKVVLDDLTFDLNFTQKSRIDMCKTCHQAIDREGFDGPEEELAHPYRSHPRLDLFLTAKSPHPMNEVGCTICHRGSGESLDFQRADHNVSRAFDPEKAERWEHDYHWHKQHYWDYPMLSNDKVEASCVQCHKTSMELIADDAPEVSEGYQLFERYGCYACHKVEWFPTKRKPGPSLKNIQAKADEGWIASWIADPRGFRPTTWMPQIFHLENFAPDMEVVKSKYGEGRPILGEEWNESAVSAITAFVLDRAPLQELAPVPVEGDAQRGRETMRVSGCLACHNMQPFEGEEVRTKDLAFDPTRYNEHGPNLRGVATKVTPEWLFWWIKDPNEMWSETRMPNLRLSDQEAADITAYILDDPDGIFGEVPEGWEVTPPESDMEVLAEIARWYFGRVSRNQMEARLAGEDPEFRWDREADLQVAVGQKLVEQYGCYSCHEIQGYETAQPIGAELTTWGSKTVDKLDWALLANQFQEAEGWDQHQREEYKAYRDNWLRQKLHEPRSYDREKVKAPTERLRMPWFDFESHEVEALVTFVVGLVEDEVQLAEMKPTAGELARNQGLQAIRQQNCVACHVIEPGTVTFRHEDGEVHTVEAELLSVDEFLDAFMHPTPPQTSMEALDLYLADYGEFLEEEVEEVGFRLLRVEPGIGMPGDNLFVERDDLLDVSPPWGGDFVKFATNYYYHGVDHYDPEGNYSLWGSNDPDDFSLVLDADGELRDHSAEPYDKLRWTFAPPVLYDEGTKLQKEWFYAFLEDPETLRPQIRVKMPTFHYPDGHAGAIAEYFAYQAELDWPARFARELRMALDMTPAELAEAAGKIKPEEVLAIENGSRPETLAKLSRLEAFAQAQGFSLQPPVDPSFERLERRSPSYLSSVADDHAAYLDGASRLAREGPQCFQCHFDSGTPPNADPIAWAPDLAITRDRLREDWVEAWLANPARIYPGTAMPGNFLSDPPQYQDLFPDSSNEEQIEAVVDWLFNYDRVTPRN